MSSHRKPFPEPSVALTAGALQDHLLQDLSLGSLLENPQHSYSGLKQKLRNDERKRRQALRNVKPTLDTGRTKKTQNKARVVDGAEYVLDPLPKPSLAQKLGLVSQPEKPLTNEEWSTVKQRSLARDDFKNPCAICQEYFATEDQVLLSCSHVFHRACIRAFERFTGRKSCPMCRKIQYQARVVHDGTKAYKEKAAVRLQSVWRGYIVRRWYKELRRTVPPKDEKLRRRFYEDKLQEITDRMVAMTSSVTVDRFLRDIDASIASSRAVFQHFENSQLHRLSAEDWLSIEVKALQRDDTDCPICLRPIHSNEVDFCATPAGDSRTKKAARADPAKTSDGFGSEPNTKTPKSATKRSSLALLSCSHLFHSKCLEALENFCVMDSNINSSLGSNGTPASDEPFTHLGSYGLDFRCPVCRALYVKHTLC